MLSEAPPQIGQAIEKPVASGGIAPMLVHNFLAWCTWFTIGMVLVGSAIPMFVPLGLALTLLGLGPFLGERLVLRFLVYFLGLLGLALLYILQGLRLDEAASTLKPRLSIWYEAMVVVVWGAGVLFTFRRWRSSILNYKKDHGA